MKTRRSASPAKPSSIHAMLPPDLALVDVGLGRVDRDERDLGPAAVEAPPGVAGAEGLLEAEVADVAGVVVSRHPDDLRAVDRGQLLLGDRVLVGKAVVGEVAGDDDEIGPGRVDLLDRAPQQLLAITTAADVHVGDLRDQHALISAAASSKAVVWMSTSCSVVAGDIRAMLWNGVIRIPRFSR